MLLYRLSFYLTSNKFLVRFERLINAIYRPVGELKSPDASFDFEVY
jgi:hypothetical protein